MSQPIFRFCFWVIFLCLWRSAFGVTPAQLASLAPNLAPHYFTAHHGIWESVNALGVQSDGTVVAWDLSRGRHYLIQPGKWEEGKVRLTLPGTPKNKCASVVSSLKAERFEQGATVVVTQKPRGQFDFIPMTGEFIAPHYQQRKFTPAIETLLANGTVIVYNLSEPDRQAKDVTGIAASDKFLVLGRDDNSFILIGNDHLYPMSDPVRVSAPISRLTFSARGDAFAVATTTGRIQLWKTPTSRRRVRELEKAAEEINLLPKIDQPEVSVKDLILTSQGNLVVSFNVLNTSFSEERFRMVFLERNGGKWRPHELEAVHHDTITTLAINAEETLLASGGPEKKVVLWDLTPSVPRVVATLSSEPGNLTKKNYFGITECRDSQAGPVLALAFSQGDEFLFAGTIGGLAVWNLLGKPLAPQP